MGRPTGLTLASAIPDRLGRGLTPLRQTQIASLYFDNPPMADTGQRRILTPRPISCGAYAEREDSFPLFHSGRSSAL